jgi:hypothetical protein
MQRHRRADDPFPRLLVGRGAIGHSISPGHAWSILTEVKFREIIISSI